MVNLSTRSLVGIALMVLGTAMLGVVSIPGLSLDVLLIGSAIVLIAGTYLVGTDVSGQIV